MTISEFEYLCTTEARELIEKHILDNPSLLALKGVNSAICSQIKYLQRCRKKLPLHYQKRCIIPSLSYEQSSSDVTAAAKAEGGDTCIDLTCGLGVDTFHFSKVFKRVITIERDELLCRVARYNFTLLEVANIEVVNSSAAEYLEALDSLAPLDIDMIYVDPARRDATKKVFLLEECSPDMNTITHTAIKLSKRFMVKLSPLFDVDMAYIFFSKYGPTSIKSVSVNDECKEVIVIIDGSKKEEFISSVVIDGESVREYDFVLPITKSSPNSLLEALDKTAPDNYNTPQPGDYLYIPDVTFYKNRTTHALMQHYNCKNYIQDNQNSVIFSQEALPHFEGERYIIKELHPYRKKELKKLFKKSCSRIKLLKRDFKLRSEQIKKELGVRDGESPIFMFTTINKQCFAIALDECSSENNNGKSNNI